jgi:hypothetical protein
MNLIVLAATGGSRKSIGVHEATVPEAAPIRQLDEGVATAFVGATSRKNERRGRQRPYQGQFGRRLTVHRRRDYT